MKPLDCSKRVRAWVWWVGRDSVGKSSYLLSASTQHFIIVRRFSKSQSYLTFITTPGRQVLDAQRRNEEPGAQRNQGIDPNCPEQRKPCAEAPALVGPSRLGKVEVRGVSR